VTFIENCSSTFEIEKNPLCEKKRRWCAAAAAVQGDIYGVKGRYFGRRRREIL